MKRVKKQKSSKFVIYLDKVLASKELRAINQGFRVILSFSFLILVRVSDLL